MLTVKGINGRIKALYGAFEPAKRTEGGCQCAQLWSYKDSTDQTVSVKGQCVNPDGAHARSWCQYEPESCTGSKSLHACFCFCQLVPGAVPDTMRLCHESAFCNQWHCSCWPTLSALPTMLCFLQPSQTAPVQKARRQSTDCLKGLLRCVLQPQQLLTASP